MAATDAPLRRGEWLRRRDSGRWARVVALDGDLPPPGCCMAKGDVILEYKPGWHTVTTGGAFLWERWERLDVDRLLALALAIGAAHG